MKSQSSLDISKGFLEPLCPWLREAEQLCQEQ